MHRKNLICLPFEPLRRVAGWCGSRNRLSEGRRQSRGRAFFGPASWRGFFKLLPSVLLLSLMPLSAAPDPDLFDGRVAGQPGGSDSASGAGDEAGSSEVSGEKNSASAESSVSSSDSSSSAGANRPASRDFSEIGQAGGGQAAPSSDTSAAGGESESSAVGGEGVPSAEGSATPSGEAGTSGSEGRDFSEIGGIRGAVRQEVEVHSSKAPPSQPLKEAGTSTGDATSNQSNQGQGTGAGGSQPAKGSGSGDYGERLPSGI